MKYFLKQILKKSKKSKARIFFPEVEDPRILEALQYLIKKKICKPVIPFSAEKFKNFALKRKFKFPWKKIIYLDSSNKELLEKFAIQLQKIRKKDKLDLQQAITLTHNRHYFACLALLDNYADSVVTGSIATTAASIFPALKLLRNNTKLREVSSTFIMMFPETALFFADCSININPTSQELADIGINTAKLAEKYGFKPKIAFLSYSTKGSGHGPYAEKTRKAAEIAHKKFPHLKLDGELQADAAISPFVAKIKAPKARIHGDANILIFPNLEAANIAYKLTERLAGAKAIGGLMTGFKKPYNDLSRGCSVEDIIILSALTALECKKT